MTVRVVRAGLLTTVQDLGRRDRQHDGVPSGGAMDAYAARLANLLVGNDEGAAVLEMTVAGPYLVFERETIIALGGAEFEAHLDGSPLLPWRAVGVRAGAMLEMGGAVSGIRGYLAIAGGVEVPLVMGSRSTNLLASFGGHEGRALRSGDTLAVGVPSGDRRPLAGRVIARSMRPACANVLRVIPGARLDAAGSDARAAVFGRDIRVSEHSDRMGYRLEMSLDFPTGREVLSAAVTMGTIQLPPNGSPILLMADCQTTGGYPVLGHVATIDLGNAAQLRPGNTVRLAEISLDEAQRLYLDRERAIEALRRALLNPL